MRVGVMTRDTRETKIYLKLELDGEGLHAVDTGVGFLNHMLELFSVHAGVDLTVRCQGDTDVDFHHSVEDVGICLGQAFQAALGDKKGIARFADRIVPMDDVAALVALDIGGRPYLNPRKPVARKLAAFRRALGRAGLRACPFHAGVNLYVDLLCEGNLHHEAEAIFKALARCVRDAVKVVSDTIPSSKGVL